MDSVSEGVSRTSVSTVRLARVGKQATSLISTKLMSKSASGREQYFVVCPAWLQLRQGSNNQRRAKPRSILCVDDLDPALSRLLEDEPIEGIL